MLDFTSALYLGMRHPSRSLPGYDALTTGRPAVLGRPNVSTEVARRLSLLLGCERGVLARSTFHGLWDVLALLGGPEVTVLRDRAAYPITEWATMRAAAAGARVTDFRHHRSDDLARKLGSFPGTRAVVVTDGWCPGCGRAAPLAEYAAVVAAHDGWLVVDDTQALGVLGPNGAGSLAQQRLDRRRVIVVSSLAKGFGVPITLIAGPVREIATIEQEGEHQTHSSPPTVPELHAAYRALRINEVCGDRLRARLADLVRRFRRLVRATGLAIRTALFPVQSIDIPTASAAAELSRELLRCGVQTVVQGARCRPGAGLTFVITARHRAVDIDRAARALRLAALTEGVQRVRG
jgi:8-amino-7-oxononanoate synthase